TSARSTNATGNELRSARSTNATGNERRSTTSSRSCTTGSTSSSRSCTTRSEIVAAASNTGMATEGGTEKARGAEEARSMGFDDEKTGKRTKINKAASYEEYTRSGSLSEGAAKGVWKS